MKLTVHEISYGWKGSGSYGEKCESGSTISIRVDFNELAVSYTINGKDYGKTFKLRSSSEYRVAVCFYGIRS